MSSHSASSYSDNEFNAIIDSIRAWYTRKTEQLNGNIANQTRLINQLESELSDLQSTLEQALSTNDKIKEQNMKLQSRLNESEMAVKYQNLLEVYNMAEQEILQLKNRIMELESRPVQSPAPAPAQTHTADPQPRREVPDLINIFLKEFLNPSRNDYTRGC